MFSEHNGMQRLIVVYDKCLNIAEVCREVDYDISFQRVGSRFICYLFQNGVYLLLIFIDESNFSEFPSNLKVYLSE